MLCEVFLICLHAATSELRTGMNGIIQIVCAGELVMVFVICML